MISSPVRIHAMIPDCEVRLRVQICS